MEFQIPEVNVSVRTTKNDRNSKSIPNLFCVDMITQPHLNLVVWSTLSTRFDVLILFASMLNVVVSPTEIWSRWARCTLSSWLDNSVLEDSVVPLEALNLGTMLKAAWLNGEPREPIHPCASPFYSQWTRMHVLFWLFLKVRRNSSVQVSVFNIDSEHPCKTFPWMWKPRVNFRTSLSSQDSQDCAQLHQVTDLTGSYYEPSRRPMPLARQLKRFNIYAMACGLLKKGSDRHLES